MGLFRKKQPEKNNQGVFYEQHFTQSHSFKGYKRFHVSYYGYKPAEDGLAQFRKAGLDLEGADILLRGVRRDEFQFVEVIINGYLVGSVTMWTEDEKTQFIKNNLFTGKVEKAHIRIDYENVGGGNKIQKREKIFLFLKISE